MKGANPMTQSQSPTYTDADDLIEPSDACPNCGERRIDRLWWDETGEEYVTCDTCGFKYDPFEKDAAE
jgi:predicted RNA-binding Zn-ribbon protein involved in translation (DUF1610 family)